MSGGRSPGYADWRGRAFSYPWMRTSRSDRLTGSSISADTQHGARVVGEVTPVTVENGRVGVRNTARATPSESASEKETRPITTAMSGSVSRSAHRDEHIRDWRRSGGRSTTTVARQLLAMPWDRTRSESGIAGRASGRCAPVADTRVARSD